MEALPPVPVARCRCLDSDATEVVRYVRLGDFQSWRRQMSQRGRRVTIEDVLLWVPEERAWLEPEIVEEALPAVLAVIEAAQPEGCTCIERFFPIEDYAEAQPSALWYLDGEGPLETLSTARGYFVHPPAAVDTASL